MYETAFSKVQTLRALVQDKYNFALGTGHYDWLEPVDPEAPAFKKFTILLTDALPGHTRYARLYRVEAVSMALGWNNGTSADKFMELYKSLTKALGKGSAEAAWREVQREARKSWGIGSTKDLWKAEVYALIEWLENHEGSFVLDHLSAAPDLWREQLARIAPVKRPTEFAPPLEQLDLFDYVEQNPPPDIEPATNPWCGEEYIPF